MFSCFLTEGMYSFVVTCYLDSLVEVGIAIVDFPFLLLLHMLFIFRTTVIQALVSQSDLTF